MLKGISMTMIVLLMKACIESSRDNFCLLPIFGYYGGYFVNNINNNYFYTYIYILLRVVSMTVWSRFFYVKIHLHNNNKQYFLVINYDLRMQCNLRPPFTLESLWGLTFSLFRIGVDYFPGCLRLGIIRWYIYFGLTLR